MSHVLTTAPDALAPSGTNASIEQRFAAMADGHRPEQPNLLLIETDLGLGAIGAYAGEEAQTPHLDRLAKSGTRFINAARDSGATPLWLALAPLDACGYDTGRFAVAEPAAEFLGSRRRTPWAAYLCLGAASADGGVGILLTALQRSHQDRKTLVLLLGAGSPAPTLLAWPGQVPPRQRHDGSVLCADWLPTVLEVARPGASRGIEFDGVDLTGHLFDGGAIPARRVAAIPTRAA